MTNPVSISVAGFYKVQDLYPNPYANMLNSFKEDNQNMMHVTLNLEQQLDFITEGLSLTGLVNFKNWSKSYYTRSNVSLLLSGSGWKLVTRQSRLL